MKGICINQDTHDIILAAGKTRPSIQDIKNFPKIYEGTHVTDFFINLLDNCACYRSNVITDFLDKYYQKEENGIAVDYSDTGAPKGMHYLCEELGVDLIEMQINGFREAGINPWITFRMNDFHERYRQTSPLFPDFLHEHPEALNGRGIPRGIISGGDPYAYDFSLEIVRNLLLDVINESLERYDPYGVELDFQREMTCFAVGGEYEGIQHMNNFMREVYKLVKKAEERWGHRIKLAVRLMPDINFCFEYGFDVMTWVHEKLIDVLVISARWASNDTDMPIALWKSLLAPYGVELYASMEMRLMSHIDDEVRYPDIETFASFAASAFSQGADKFYIYNYYIHVDAKIDRSKDFDFDISHSVCSYEQYNTVINTLGDPETIMKLKRRHMVTMKCRLPMWRRSSYLSNQENRGVDQLPLTYRERGSFRLMVGEIPENAKVTFRFAVKDLDSALADLPKVWINSVPCEYIGTVQDSRLTSDTLLCYDVPREAFKVNLTALISSETEITTRYVDAYIKPQN